jgi:hypothetical protein
MFFYILHSNCLNKIQARFLGSVHNTALNDMPTLLDANDTFNSEVQIAVGNYEDEVCCCDIMFLLCFVKGNHMIQKKLMRLFL